MAKWLRFRHRDAVKFGALTDGRIEVHQGDLFAAPESTGELLAVEDVEVLIPVVPSKMIALANNSRSLLTKLGVGEPLEPLYLLKANSSFHPHGKTIRRPAAYEGKVIFEAELGLVIAKTCRAVGVDQAYDYLFGCTCVNDVTAIELLKKDPSFDQWTRSKAADTFGVFGPVIDTDADPAELVIKATLNGQERQNYTMDDLVFKPAELISRISHDLTLLPGDLIACGTSAGVGSMKPGSTIDVSIEGIGTLSNRFE